MKTTLSLLLAIIALPALAVPVGFRQAPVTYFTNNGALYFGSNGPSLLLLTNSVNLDKASLTVGTSGSFTNNGAMVVSNTVQLGWVQESAKFVSLTDVTNSDVNVQATSLLVITNTSATGMVLTGFANEGLTAIGALSNTWQSGRTLRVINLSGTNCTLLGDSTNSTSFYRIRLPEGSSTNVGSHGTATFLYFSTNWHLLHLLP